MKLVCVKIKLNTVLKNEILNDTGFNSIGDLFDSVRGRCSKPDKVVFALLGNTTLNIIELNVSCEIYSVMSA